MSVHVLQYWILHNYSHHNEEANELKPTVKPRCIKLTTIMWLRGQNNSRALKTRQTELCVASAWGSIKRRLDWMAITYRLSSMAAKSYRIDPIRSHWESAEHIHNLAAQNVTYIQDNN